VAHAKTKGIFAANVTTYAAHPVAEFAFALLLCVARKIYPAYNQLREGTNFDVRGLQGVSLSGRTLGVIGTGRIGKNVALLGAAFGMTVLIHDTHPDDAWAQQNNLSYAPLETVLSQSDIISLHIPYLPETHHLLNAERFALMKKGSILINTARGEIVDTHALLAALRDGTLRGAGLDVLEEERTLKKETEMIATNVADAHYDLLAANHVLIDMPNVIVTPHIAFSTAEAMEEIVRVTAQSIANYISGTEQTYL
jgi:D-lactate dehydrogenase